MALTPEAYKSFWEILIAFGFYEDAQWAQLVAWVLDAASCGVHLEGKVR